MMTKSLQRMVAVLLCVFLCLGTAFFSMGAAHAAESEDATGATEPEDTTSVAEPDTPASDTQPPAFGVGIELTPPEGWTQTSANIALCVTDETGGGFASVEVRTGEDEVWLNITNGLTQTENCYQATMQVTENGTFFARVTGFNGEIAEKSCAVKCFDTTDPELRASIVEDTLHLEATDDLSGVAQITVGGASFEYGTAEIPLDELGTSELIPIQVADYAGNLSQVVLVVNPRAQITCCPCDKSDDAQPAPSQPQESAPVQTQKPVESTPAPSPTPSAPVKTPATATPSTTTPAETKAPTEPDSTTQPPDEEQTPNPLTPDGQGTVVDDATDQDGKEFFTFTTPDENTFYLVIDKQRDSENVYFLNAVTESDLLALAEKDKEPEESVSAIPEPEPEPVCTCTDKCAPGAINTGCPICAVSMKDCTGTAPAESEPEPEKNGNGGAVILLLLAVLAAGGAGYYLKVWKPKHDLDDAEDFDDLTGEDEVTVNEDDLEPSLPHGPSDEPEEPDFQSGYGPEEDE